MNCKCIKVPALSVTVVGRHILALAREDDILSLVSFNEELEIEDKITTFKCLEGFVLDAYKDKLLLAIDNKLVLIEDGKQRIVLESNKAKNFFWHATRVGGSIFVHEYGEPPTYIYASEDLMSWRRIVSNVEVDIKSRHFHYITWDPYRKWLIATLGDGCLTRAIYSEDLGQSWGPLYRGPWQFVPIMPLRDKIVFGMDSGIAKGGIGSYDFTTGRWNFTFLKWQAKGVRFAQMCDLKLLTNNLYVAGLGQPQAIVVSRDARRWYLVHAEAFDEQFNMHVNISEREKFVVCSTGKNLLLVTKNELESLCGTANPVITDYKLGFIERLIGLGFNIKHRLMF